MASIAAAAPAAHAPSSGASSGLARLPFLLAAIGGFGALIGILFPSLQKQFAFSWLLAFMFYLSIMLGALFLVILHHIFDAQWSVPIRRITEHLSCSAPVMAVLFVPILFNALFAGPDKALFAWMHADASHDHALYAKKALFNKPTWVVVSILLFVVWHYLTTGLRKASLEQDRTGAASCTHRMRFLSALGIFLFAVTLTLGAILWMKSLQWQWFSTMYGVYYFAGSVWLTLGTVYVITIHLARGHGPLSSVVQPVTFHDIGKLFFAFTVFYAYIHFSQYFLIWNAAMPEETFWYVLREQGSWWEVGLLILFGHFFLPFLLLLRIDTKMSLTVMGPMIAWAWLMHYVDMTFNVMPVRYPEGLHLTLWDPLLWGGMAVFLGWRWWLDFQKYPAWPQKHPRLKEAVTHHEIPAPGEAAAHH